MNPSLALRRSSAAWLFCFGLSAAVAQTTTPRSAPSVVAADEVIALPEFSVGASANDNSWVASSSMSGTRTNVPIQNFRPPDIALF